MLIITWWKGHPTQDIIVPLLIISIPFNKNMQRFVKFSLPFISGIWSQLKPIKALFRQHFYICPARFISINNPRLSAAAHLSEDYRHSRKSIFKILLLFFLQELYRGSKVVHVIFQSQSHTLSEQSMCPALGRCSWT